MKTFNLLFLCTGNSCRSQMAEGWARELAQTLPDFLSIKVDSAGLEAHGLNPNAVAVMAEMGVDITSQQSSVVSDYLLDWADLVVSVCSHADQHCPILPADTEKLHLPFDDPAAAIGTEIEIMEEFRRVCFQIRQAVADLLQSRLLNELDQKQGNVFDKHDVKIVSRERGFDGFVPVDVLHLKYKLFFGGWSEEIRRELAMRSSAVGVLLFDPKRDAVVMVRQFRTGILSHEQSPWILEVVAGIVETGEAPADVVKREAKEEANCEITELIPICSYFNSPGWSNEKIYLYCALVDSEAAGGVHGIDHENEDILVVTLPLEEAVNAVNTGEINNAMAIIAIQWLQLNKEQVIRQWHPEK